MSFSSLSLSLFFFFYFSLSLKKVVWDYLFPIVVHWQRAESYCVAFSTNILKRFNCRPNRGGRSRTSTRTSSLTATTCCWSRIWRHLWIAISTLVWHLQDDVKFAFESYLISPNVSTLTRNMTTSIAKCWFDIVMRATMSIDMCYQQTTMMT